MRRSGDFRMRCAGQPWFTRFSRSLLTLLLSGVIGCAATAPLLPPVPGSPFADDPDRMDQFDEVCVHDLIVPDICEWIMSSDRVIRANNALGR